ncbi:gmc oxidoreductase, partial [Cystoisospora suis]
GAVYTPVTLFNSGVGPAEQIEKLGLSLVHSVPQLGSNFIDRIAVPVGVFVTRKQYAKFSSPRVSDVVGINPLGPDC